MSGFVVTYRPSATPPSSDGTPVPDQPDLEIDIPGDDVERFSTDDNHIVLIDGYVLGVSSQRLVTALVSHDDAFLSRVHGHYCVLIIHPDGEMQGFCDRFGAKTLYWQITNEHRIIISSRWPNMQVFDRHWDDLGLAETLRYRCTSGQRTMVAGISKLPNWQRVSFGHNGEISVSDTASFPQWPTSFATVSFAEKLDETRRALNDALNEIAHSYDNAAIFLSGGVDSSLLAALSRSHFKKCLLVTPVFPGEYNPELETAKVFAKDLQLEHLLVDIDLTKLEIDLRELTRSKGGQIHFHSLALHQLMEAIPDEYELLIHGERADTLFGTTYFTSTESHLRWKRFADVLPAFAWRWASKLPIPRLKRFCRLMQSSTLDITLQEFQIQYDPQSKSIISGFYEARIDELYAHKAAIKFRSESNGSLRGLLLDINFSDAGGSEIRDIALSATRFGKKVFMPFMDEPVINVAKTLTRNQYFRDGYPKPVLRELACEHFERELIYRRKYGFEVPLIPWLKGPFASLVETARQERKLFDGSVLGDLDVENHHSLFWTLISWQLIDDQRDDRCLTPICHCAIDKTSL